MLLILFFSETVFLPVALQPMLPYFACILPSCFLFIKLCLSVVQVISKEKNVCSSIKQVNALVLRIIFKIDVMLIILTLSKPCSTLPIYLAC